MATWWIFAPIVTEKWEEYTAPSYPPEVVRFLQEDSLVYEDDFPGQDPAGIALLEEILAVEYSMHEGRIEFELGQMPYLPELPMDFKGMKFSKPYFFEWVEQSATHDEMKFRFGLVGEEDNPLAISDGEYILTQEGTCWDWRHVRKDKLRVNEGGKISAEALRNLKRVRSFQRSVYKYFLFPATMGHRTDSEVLQGYHRYELLIPEEDTISQTVDLVNKEFSVGGVVIALVSGHNFDK